MRKFIRASLFAAFGMMAVLLAYGSVGATPADEKKDEKLPDISEIMLKGHKGTDAYMAKIKGAAKDGQWEDAQKYAKTLAVFGNAARQEQGAEGRREVVEGSDREVRDQHQDCAEGDRGQGRQGRERGVGRYRQVVRRVPLEAQVT